jgi:hypothetical protein
VYNITYKSIIIKGKKNKGIWIVGPISIVNKWLLRRVNVSEVIVNIRESLNYFRVSLLWLRFFLCLLDIRLLIFRILTIIVINSTLPVALDNELGCWMANLQSLCSFIYC